MMKIRHKKVNQLNQLKLVTPTKPEMPDRLKILAACTTLFIGGVCMWGLWGFEKSLISEKRAAAISKIGLPNITVTNFKSLPQTSQEITSNWSVALLPDAHPYAYRASASGKIDYITYDGARSWRYVGSGSSAIRSLKAFHREPVKGMYAFPVLCAVIGAMSVGMAWVVVTLRPEETTVTAAEVAEVKTQTVAQQDKSEELLKSMEELRSAAEEGKLHQDAP